MTSNIQLYQGDCLEVMKNIPDKSVDLVLADPPYGTTACSWDSVIPLELMWEQLKRITKPNSAIVLFGGQPFTSILITSNLKHFKYCWVWDKVKSTNMLNASHQPLRRHEDIVVFYSAKPTYNPQKTLNPRGVEKRSMYAYSRDNHGGDTVGKINKGGVSSAYEADKLLPTSIQVFSKDHKPVHPTQKPVALMEYLIKTYSNEGTTVLDFTMGSGTTGVACVNTNRNFIGIEMDEGYFKIAQERIEKA